MNARAKASLIVIALLACAFPALRNAGRVAYDPRAGVTEQLPTKAGAWTADVYSYCTNRTCLTVWRASQLQGVSVCAKCGGGLSPMAVIERELLPEDTKLQRAEYTAPGGRSVVVSIVFSGRERSSIHRPEVCLAGEGSAIADARDAAVELAGRAPLPLRVLTVQRDQRTVGGGIRRTSSYFAYWFVSREHETSSHFERMLFMASDRIFRGVTHRWAYISIAGDLPESGDPLPILREFLRDFVPQLAPR